ncbi:hypothetical protein AAMO2058_000122200 [Amorphochlora amoebiformis]
MDSHAPPPKIKSKKKRKRSLKEENGSHEPAQGTGSKRVGFSEDYRKPSKHQFGGEEKREGRKYTVSVAIPGSIVSNAQSPELRTYLVGQIARALTIFEVDEIVVFSEDGAKKSLEGEFQGNTRRADPNVFMARVLQYLETPQYLRKDLFPMHPDLKYAGLLNPLDAPHHVRIDTKSAYREGVVVNRPTKPGAGVWVNIGLRQCALVGHNIPVKTRVTVKLPPQAVDPRGRMPKTLKGSAVAPSKPRTEAGIYWGYSTRLASGLGGVIQNCPYKGGYDLTIGTSERGVDAAKADFELPKFRHLLLVFGGLGGLEDAIEGDESLREADPSALFTLYINSCTHQG